MRNKFKHTYVRKICGVLLLVATVATFSACKKEVIDSPSPSENSNSIRNEITLPIEQQLKESVDAIQYNGVANNMETFVRGLGFVEFYPTYWTPTFEITHVFEPHNMVYTDDTFKLEFDYINYNEETKESSMTNGWILYGTKADGLANLTEYKAENFDEFAEYSIAEEMPEYKNDFCETREYIFYNLNKDGLPIDYVECHAYYFPSTGNLYNLVREFDEALTITITYPRVLLEQQEDMAYMAPRPIETIWVDNYPIEVSEFTLKYGDKEETYKYRVGMTLSTWAVSDLNTSDWVLGFEETLFSSDYKYMVSYADCDVRLFLDETGTIVAEDNNMYTKEELETAFTFQRTPATQMHLVNWQTPLLMPGLRIESDYTGYYLYKNFNIGHVYSTEDTLNIYMTNISEDMISDIKIYAFAEPQSIIEVIEEGGGLHAHSKANPKLYELLQIPEDAYCIPLMKVEHEQTTEEEYYIEDSVVAVYKTTEDPNFTPYNEKALAITYKDTLVYWVHMPRFSEDITLEDEEGMTEEEFQEFLKEMEEQGVIVEEITEYEYPEDYEHEHNHNH